MTSNEENYYSKADHLTKRALRWADDRSDSDPALVLATNATTYAILALADAVREQSQPATYVMNAETCEECSGRTVAEMLDRNRIAYRQTPVEDIHGGKPE